MSLGIEEILESALGDRSVRFVFPSEICSEAWLARSLRSLRGPKVIESDRFMGWDRLKEAAAPQDGRPPVDDCLRRIFAARLLADNAEAPFLGSILAPAYAREWQPFAGYLAARLPALGILPKLLRAAGGAQDDDPATADWLEVRARYEAFLGAIGRFEPSYESRALGELEGKTVIFFPELIEDFEEYRPILERAPSVSLVGLPDTRVAATLRRPATGLAELRETLSEAGTLLDGGMASDDIAITVAGLDRYRPYLEREASLLSVPIALRSGLRLVATPGGRLFAALRDAYASGFSFDALRDLLLSPAWPWKAPKTGSGIMAEGMRLHAIAPWPETLAKGGRRIDAWERSLSGPLATAYRALRSRISAMAAAPDFRSLMKAYNAFKSEFLSREAEDWETEADLSLARCVVKLEELVVAQAESGLDVPGPFALFMRVLESETYVSAGGAGIPVYEWRVAAGIFPKRHFVLHASQDALALPPRGFDFLGERLRSLLGAALYGDPRAADRDAAPDFIKAYSLSGESVSFSCPEAGFAGEEATHGFLVSVSTEEPSARGRDGSYGEEASWLSGRGPAPLRLHRPQAVGLAAAARSAAGPAASDGCFLEPPTALLAFSRLERGDGKPSLDSTAIDYYLACPYAYLYLRLLRARPEASGISFVDALFLGDVYHAALALLFGRIREADGRFRSERVDAYRGLLEACLDEAFVSLSRSRGPFVAVVLEAYRGRLEGYLSRLLGEEAERFAGLEIYRIEEELELDYPDVAGGVVLRGRIDRISRSEKGDIIVDYKKGRLPDKRSVAPDETGAIAEAQIPCYLRLAAAEGDSIDSAWYLSIEGYDAKPPSYAACAFGDESGAYVPRPGLGPFLDAFDAALGRTARGIAAGEFPLAPKETQKIVCQACGARGICRERYALRFGAPAVEGKA
jgi:RecB family exonuclease